VHNQREEYAKRIVGRIKILTLECQKFSDQSAQTYEHLPKYLKLRKLEAHLQEAQQQESTMQAQMKLLTVVEQMKISLEQCAIQQQIISI
jgi:hypothetical protein